MYVWYLLFEKVHNPDVQYLLFAGLIDSIYAQWVWFVANTVGFMNLFYDAWYDSLYLQGSIIL